MIRNAIPDKHVYHSNKLHTLFLEKRFDDYQALALKWRAQGDRDDTVIIRSWYHFDDEELVDILHTLVTRFGFDPNSPANRRIFRWLVGNGRIYPMLWVLALTTHKVEDAKTIAKQEMERLTIKATQENYDPGVSEYGPTDVYEAFEWFLTENGAPKTINYWGAMYSSRASYCDVLESVIDLIPQDSILHRALKKRSLE